MVKRCGYFTVAVEPTAKSFSKSFSYRVSNICAISMVFFRNRRTSIETQLVFRNELATYLLLRRILSASAASAARSNAR
jgi:hypothetical protein